MKNWKLRIFSPVAFTGILVILAIIITACTPKNPQTEGSAQAQTAAAVTTDSYAAILNGDFSGFAGTWVNGEGTRVELKPDGIFGNYAEYPDVIIGNVRIAADGVYLWGIGTEWFDSPITIYPAGIDVMGGNGILQTDTTKVRITAVDIPYRSEEVFYREGEAPAKIVQTQTAASSGTHPEILNGDLSAFAGTWVNGHGKSITLTSDGFFWNGYHSYNFKNINGSYSWDVSMDGDSTPIRLFPAGIEFINGNNQIIQTDTTKPRINIDFVDSNADVFYREWEIHAENDSSSGDPNGQWRFESGGNINFFGQEFITISPNGHIEIWGIRPGQSYIEGGGYTKETASWNINDGGEFAVYHESGVNGVFYFSFTIRDDVMHITDQNGNSAVFRKVYLQ